MPTSLTPHANLWIERDNQVVLSRWRVQLLEAIEETGSISAAAERMKVQYRCAWDKLDEMETGLGERLVERHAGGRGGGGTRLTPAGRAYVASFNCFAQGIDEVIAKQFEQAFEKSKIPAGGT
jgi:molybdate transport system regulatory protein